MGKGFKFDGTWNQSSCAQVLELTKGHWLFQEKSKQRYLLEIPPEIYRLVSLSLKFQPWEFCKTVLHALEIAMPKTKSHRNPTFSMIAPGNSTFFSSLVWMDWSVCRIKTSFLKQKFSYASPIFNRVLPALFLYHEEYFLINKT